MKADMKPFRKIAKHVVKFADGSYLTHSLSYGSRVTRQWFAQRWLTWASAKAIAESTSLAGTGARAVRLVGPPTDGDENLRNRQAAVYLIEATDYERHHLWVDHSEHAFEQGWGDPRTPRVPWETITLGYHQTIGHCARLPVHVSVSFARIRGQVIAFYEATSQVVDHRRVEKWLKTEFPRSRGKTNPTNFHHCLDSLKLWEKA